MNIEEFRQVAEQVADRVERAAKVADGKDTLNESRAYWAMFQSKDEWFADAQARGCLRAKPGNPYWARPNKDTFHQWVTALLEDMGHPTYASAQTHKRLRSGEVLAVVPEKVDRLFSGMHCVLPLHALIRDGYGDKISEAVELATEGGAPVTAKTIRRAVTQTRTKYNHQRAIAGKRHNTPAANDRTESARVRAQEAFDKLMSAAAKSANGPDEVNTFLQYVEDTLKQKTTPKVVA